MPAPALEQVNVVAPPVPTPTAEAPVTATPPPPAKREGLTCRIGGAAGVAAVLSRYTFASHEGEDDESVFGLVLSQSASVGTRMDERTAVALTEHFQLMYFDSHFIPIVTVGAAYKGFRAGHTSFEVGPAAVFAYVKDKTLVGGSLGFDVLLAPAEPYGWTITGDVQVFSADLLIAHVGIGVGLGD